MKVILTLFVCLFLFCVLCKKDQVTYDITGYVFHKASKQPLAGCEVILEHPFLDYSDRLEFPNGKPFIKKLKVITNATGRYVFRLPEDRGIWLAPYLRNGYQGSSTFLQSRAALFDTLMGFPSIDRNRFDTIWAEKEGYIRFNIQHGGFDYMKDTLVVNKSYYVRHSTSLRIPTAGDLVFHGSSYVSNHMGFVGSNVMKTIIDTIAAESIRSQVVEWYYKRTDTLLKRRETIQVNAGSVSDVTIAY